MPMDELSRAAEKYEEELEQFATQPTASEEWLEGMREFVLSAAGADSKQAPPEPGAGDSEMQTFGGVATEEAGKFDPLGTVRDFFESVSGVEKQDVCKSLFSDIAEVGKRSAIHKDLANLLENANEPGAASSVRDVAQQEKDVAQALLRVASNLDCDVPSDLQSAVNRL